MHTVNMHEAKTKLSHIFLWWLADDPALSAKAREVIGDGNNVVYISAASVWEISVKKSLGKLEAPENIGPSSNRNVFRNCPYRSPTARQPGNCRLTTETPSTGCLLPRPDVRI